MIAQEGVRKLTALSGKSGEKILSLYLSLEPPAGKPLFRGFETLFKSLTHSLEKEIKDEEIDEFRRDCARVRNFLTDYKPAGRSLAVFADESRDFVWAKEFNVPVSGHACWREKPRLLPLLEALDEYERYGVILTDKRRARLFTYYLGRIEEEEGAIAWRDVHRFRSAGKDHLRSAFKLQRKVDMHVGWHLKHVGERMEQLFRRRPFDRIILGGSREAVDSLMKTLPAPLHAKVSGRLPVSVRVSDKELEESLRKLETQIEREKEKELVRYLMETAGAGNHGAALGLEAVLLWLHRGEIHRLVYSENFKARDILEETALSVISGGGSLEEVKGDSARRLDEAGGIGVILRKHDRVGGGP